MPSVTITLTDTPAGGVSVHSSFQPAIGARCSLAQSAALDIISRTKRHYGLDDPLATAPGVNIDAAHVSRTPAALTPAMAKRLASLELGPERGR